MTLTETASLTKKLLIFGSIFLVILIGGGLGYQAYHKYQLSKIPPPEEKPDVKWGVLPKPNFPVGNVSSSNYSYTLDTSTGEVPKDLPKIVKVYFIPQLGTTLLAADKAKDLAVSFNFSNGPETLSPTKYAFTDSSGGKFIVDLNSGNFQFDRQQSTDSAKPHDEIIADQPKIVTDFKRFLSNKNLLKDQLRDGRTRVIYEGFSQKESSSAAISLWQEDMDGRQIVTDKFITGLIEGTVTKFQDDDQKFLKLKYTFWPIDQTNFSTYPVKSAGIAFQQLQEGLGAVVVEPKKPQVSITKISLVYYLSEVYPQYLEPVFLFEGGSFAAFISAITDEYLQR